MLLNVLLTYQFVSQMSFLFDNFIYNSLNLLSEKYFHFTLNIKDLVAPNLKYRENIGRHKKITMADMVFVSTYFFMILMLTKLVLHMFWLQID